MLSQDVGLDEDFLSEVPLKRPDRRPRFPYCTSLSCAGRGQHAHVRVTQRPRDDFFCPCCGFAVVWLPNESLQ